MPASPVEFEYMEDIELDNGLKLWVYISNRKCKEESGIIGGVLPIVNYVRVDHGFLVYPLRREIVGLFYHPTKEDCEFIDIQESFSDEEREEIAGLLTDLLNSKLRYFRGRTRPL